MTVSPLRRQAIVACDPATAYRLWIEDIGAWWPLDPHSCFGPGGTVRFDGDRIIETGPAGQTAVWGTVSEREEGARLRFSWHPGQGPEEATTVTLTFTPLAGEEGTLVTLVHAGWEARPDGSAARADYAGGWRRVLDCLVGHRSATPGAVEAWLVLEHTPGPSVAEGGVFASPEFAEHLVFLRSLQADGVLVAAGPLADEDGVGMTVVHLRDLDRAQRVVDAAQYADGCVAAGVLEVRVRPWRVALAAG